MELTNEQVDQILTEAQGKCCHETKYRKSPVAKQYIQFYCTCGNVIGSSSQYYRNPKLKPEEDYKKFSCIPNPSPTTNWEDYGEVLEWARKQNWWSEFADCFLYKFSIEFYDDKYTDVDIIANPETGSRAIAKFLEEKKNGQGSFI